MSPFSLPGALCSGGASRVGVWTCSRLHSAPIRTIFREGIAMMPASEIPRPAGSLLAHSLRFVKNTMRFYEDGFRECGDIFATRIPGLGNWVYVCSPDLVKTMIEAPPEVLAGGDVE